jgi:hypothetical protein
MNESSAVSIFEIDFRIGSCQYRWFRFGENAAIEAFEHIRSISPDAEINILAISEKEFWEKEGDND